MHRNYREIRTADGNVWRVSESRYHPVESYIDPEEFRGFGLAKTRLVCVSEAGEKRAVHPRGRGRLSDAELAISIENAPVEERSSLTKEIFAELRASLRCRACSN